MIDVQHGVEQREVGAGPNRQIEIGVACDRRHARIDNDQPSAALAALPQVMRRDGCALRRIRSGDHDDVRDGKVGPRVGCPIDTEREFVGGAGRDHAQPSVVVDVLGAERHACELA